MTDYHEIVYITEKYNALIPMKDKVCEIVSQSKIKNGVVYVITKHTTTGITVNEKLECLEDDILGYLGREFPEDGFYYHARFLDSYGAMAGNPTSHMKAMITGSHCVFPVLNHQVILGNAQEIYLAEYDGPQKRTVSVIIMGDQE